MDIAFWIITALLALAFLGAGAMKVIKDKAALQEAQMGWVEDYSAGAVKAIGLIEIVGAVGLVLPAALDIAPVLSPIAAICLALVMVGAVVVHVRRHEPPAPAVVLAVLSVVAAALGFAVI